MKCIKSKATNEITRVNDELAATKVQDDQTHKFVPKREWKLKVRKD